MNEKQPIRKQLANLLDWQGAHVSFRNAVEDVPEEFRYQKTENIPYNLWQLIEHLRITQADILDFSKNPRYQELNWPGDYWPSTETPAAAQGWEKSIELYEQDLDEFKELILNPEIDLFIPLPHGDGQNLFREAVLLADHTSYHVGQIVALRRSLGIW